MTTLRKLSEVTTLANPTDLLTRAAGDARYTLAGAGLSDGDKGDISVSGGIWTIDNNVVSMAKLADIATASFIGRTTAGTGDPEVLTAAQATALLNAFTTTLKGLVPAPGTSTGKFLKDDGTWANVSGTVADGDKGDITVSGSGTTWTVDANAITLAQMAQVATATFLGRTTAATGNVEVLTAAQATALLNVFGTGLKGLVPSSPGGTTTYLRADGGWGTPTGNGAVVDGDKGDISVTSGLWSIDPNVVTFAKMQDIATATFVGRTTAGTGDPEALTPTQATAMLDAFTTTLKGLVPAPGTATGKFLKDDGTWASVSLGSNWTPVQATGTGSSQNITLPESVTSSDIIVAVEGLIQDPADFSVSGTTLTITAPSGAAITARKLTAASGSLTNNSVTYAIMQDISATNRVLGRKTAGAGDPEELTASDLSTMLSLGTMASQAASSVAITGGSVTGITDITVADGGTGASTASGARTNLGLVIGTDVKPNAPAIQAVTSSATVTPTFADDMVKITAQAAALTLANWSGTAIPGWGMVIRIKDNGTARAISYGTNYRAIGVTLPTTTVVSKTLYLGCMWNADDSKIDVLSVAQEA